MINHTCDLCCGVVALQRLNDIVRIDPYDLERSALGSPCMLCSILYGGLCHAFKDYDGRMTRRASSLLPDNMSLKIMQRKAHGTLIVRLFWMITADAERKLYEREAESVEVEFFTIQEKPSIWTAFGAGRTLMDCTSFEVCQRMVPYWIKRCSDTHAACGDLESKSAFIPTRLINIGSPSADPCLVERVKPPAPYIALSYCWGQRRPLVTERETLSKHMKGLAWSSIPATFRDVMILARSLGIEYIWIDALCIIQDDIDDWNQEAATMANVYSNSYFTIAPLIAHDAEAGIFQKSNAGPSVAEIPAPGRDGKDTVVYSRQALTHMQSSNGYPLLQRGWTFQEQLLSPRVLYIEEFEISWECNTNRWCCCQHEHDVTDFVHHQKADFSRFLQTRHIEPYIDQTLPEEDRFRVSCRHMWQHMTTRYTAKLLTKLTDRLIALAGIAEVFSQAKRGRYLAGLWEDDIVHGLLWYCSEAENYTWRPSPEYIAPSWSWASVDCTIAYHSHHLPRLPSDPSVQVKVISGNTVLTGTGAYGAVSEGTLKFEGKLAKGRYEFEEWDYRPSSTHKIIINGNSIIFWADYHCATLHSTPLRDNDELHCLLLWDNGLNGRDRAGHGLILREANAKSDYATFERVGLCTRIQENTLIWFESTETQMVCLV